MRNLFLEISLFPFLHFLAAQDTLPTMPKRTYVTFPLSSSTLIVIDGALDDDGPNLSIQYYGQPFISRGTYTDLNFVSNSLAKDLNERVTVYDQNQISRVDNAGDYLIDENRDGTTDYEIEDPDFAFVQFRSNLVVRWEYIPGSEIFLVWSQGVNGSGDPMDSLGRNLDGQILDQKLDNTFLIKATYRFVL